jgi:hypothetical protein
VGACRQDRTAARVSRTETVFIFPIVDVRMIIGAVCLWFFTDAALRDPWSMVPLGIVLALLALQCGFQRSITVRRQPPPPAPLGAPGR